MANHSHESAARSELARARAERMPEAKAVQQKARHLESGAGTKLPSLIAPSACLFDENDNAFELAARLISAAHPKSDVLQIPSSEFQANSELGTGKLGTELECRYFLPTRCDRATQVNLREDVVASDLQCGQPAKAGSPLENSTAMHRATPSTEEE